MKSPKGIAVAYNTQIATSEKHKLIIDFDVTNTASDQVSLSRVAIKAKEALKLKNTEVIADTGYYSGKEVKKCIESGIIPYIPKPRVNCLGIEEEFNKEKFYYDKEKGLYICPNQQELNFRAHFFDKKGLKMIKYQCRKCDKCPDKKKCTTNKRGRTIIRWEHEELMEEMQERVKGNPKLMKKRKAMVEHPFGTIKRTFGYDHLLLRTLEKVNAEFSLTFLAYNIKRVLNIMNPIKLIG